MMTPNHINILLHYYTSPDDHPRIHAPAVEQAAEEFVSDGILFADRMGKYDANNRYYITDKGKVWLNMILKTPYPKQIWVDQSGNPINI